MYYPEKVSGAFTGLESVSETAAGRVGCHLVTQILIYTASDFLDYCVFAMFVHVKTEIFVHSSFPPLLVGR